MCNTLIKLQVLLSALCVVSGLKQFVPLTSKSLLNTLRTLRSDSALKSTSSSIPGLGGKIIITGIGKVDDDEFTLNLFNEQTMWSTVMLATEDAAAAKKKFLSRTARYSGLLNVLDFATVNLEEKEDVAKLLVDANSWIAFNVTQSAIPALSQAALDAGIKRVIFTTELPPSRINETVIPEFDAALLAFEAAGSAFTGIRHGTIIEGKEDNAYEIVNATVPCLEDTVERGVLARVVAELLLIDKSANQQCGVCSSSQFAAAYLDVLRSSGLTRQQEVTKMFSGGLQRVARLTVDEYESQRKKNEEKQAIRDQKKIDDDLNLEREKRYLAALPEGTTKMPSDLYRDPNASLTPGWDEDDEDLLIETEEEKLKKRTKEILQTVWQEFDMRMMAKSTSKMDFFDKNKEMAEGLALQEFADAKEKMKETQAQKDEKELLYNTIIDVNRKQYAKLLSLERREMINQKDISDTWVKFVYLLLERSLAYCEEKEILFHNMDEYAQTLLLRSQANIMRSACNLPSYEVIYDPLDASVIVAKMSDSLGDMTGDEVSAQLMKKHGNTLKTVAALRGAAQIIELAIETLKKELPPAPPSVKELRRAESAAKQSVVSQGRLEGIKNRGKPKSEEDNSVGRM